MPSVLLHYGPRSSSLQSGFTLLEVMVAATVLSVGMLGVGALALAGIRDGGEARDRTAAALLVAELAARLRVEAPCPASCPLPEDWQDRVARDLDDGVATLCRDATVEDGTHDDPACDGAGPAVIKLFWRGPDRPERLVLRANR